MLLTRERGKPSGEQQTVEGSPLSKIFFYSLIRFSLTHTYNHIHTQFLSFSLALSLFISLLSLTHTHLHSHSYVNNTYINTHSLPLFPSHSLCFIQSHPHTPTPHLLSLSSYSPCITQIRTISLSLSHTHTHKHTLTLKLSFVFHFPTLLSLSLSFSLTYTVALFLVQNLSLNFSQSQFPLFSLSNVLIRKDASYLVWRNRKSFW